jgi:coproporphyrinogen III oxidase-like Fe-S oxidoreductase
MPVIGLGLQAFDQEVLKAHSRPAKIENFSRVAKELASICKVEIQILFGLPGDTPKGFMHALEFALSLPASVRVFHTLILPDALMTRASPEFDIKFDPHTLKIQSCQGWSEADIERTARELDEITAQDQGGRTDMWWSLNSARTRSITAGH